MATKKSAKDEALEEIQKMDEGSAEKKASTKSTKPKATKPKAEDPPEKEVISKVKVDANTMTAVEDSKPVKTEAEIHAAEKEAARRDIEKAINDTMPPTGFDLDDEDAPEPPETEKQRFITTKDIPAAQRFRSVSPVVKAEKTVMVTTKNMKEFLKK